jgi:hypothetical protein
MNKKRTLVYLSLAVLLVAGTFGPPLASPGVRAAPGTSGSPAPEVQFISAPPYETCLGDTIPVVIAYTNLGGPFSGPIVATASGGTFTPRDWLIFGTVPTQRLEGSFTANQKGTGRITLSLPNAGVRLGGTPATTFRIVDCNKTLVMAFSAQADQEGMAFRTEFFAKGGLVVDRTSGNVTGGGYYSFTHTVLIGAGATSASTSGLTCPPRTIDTQGSSFSIEHGSATVGGISFQVHFVPFDFNAVNMYCRRPPSPDLTRIEVVPAGRLDPNAGWPLGVLNFPTGVTHLYRYYGDVYMSIRLTNRKSR